MATPISPTAPISTASPPASCARSSWTARARNAGKRSGGARVPLEDDIAFTGQRAALVTALDDALTLLEKQDSEKARILELRYFGGLTAAESAEILGVPVYKINRQMRLAQAWLRRELGIQPDTAAPEPAVEGSATPPEQPRETA